MQLHEVRRADLSNKKRIRVGRGPGSGIGKTSGRGLKGATARSGYAMKVTYEGGQMPLFRRLPKRGFSNSPFRCTFEVVNVGELAAFKAGSKVGPEELRKAGLLGSAGRNQLKILGEGELKVALNVAADAFSKSALEKIEKAGGKVEYLHGAPKKPTPDFKKIEAAKLAAAKVKEGGKPEGGKPAKTEGKPEGAKPAKAEGSKPEGGAEAAKPVKPAKAEGAKPAKPAGEKPTGEAKPAKAPKPPKPAQPQEGGEEKK